MRLDVYVAKLQTISRDSAIELIKKGGVKIDNKVQNKPSYQLKSDETIVVEESMLSPYVSRAGLKLEQALQEFNINPKGLICLDIGSSTGGFTDCLLKHGAKHVTCVDVGTNQLHPTLINHKKIKLHEQTDFREYVKVEQLQKFDLITIDVSFISSEAILKHIYKLTHEATKVILLYKPQYELGHEPLISKQNGYKFGLKIEKMAKTKQKGKKGTQEFLLYFHTVKNFDNT